MRPARQTQFGCDRLGELRGKLACAEFGAVVMATVAAGVRLLLKSAVYMSLESVLVIAQLAFGAVVEQERYTRPMSLPEVRFTVRVFPVVAPASTVIGVGLPRLGGVTGDAVYCRT